MSAGAAPGGGITPGASIAAPVLPDGLDTPTVVVDLDAVERNVARLADELRARGVALRPHVKTHKSVAIGRLQLAAGAAGLTAGNLGEAEVFAAADVTDLFVAYPVWAAGPKASRLRALHDAADVAVGVDSDGGAARLAAAVAGGRRPLRVLVEVDSGGRRTGVADPESVVGVAQAARRAGLAVVGVFTHGGHSYAGPGAAAAAARDEVATLAAAADGLRDAGFDVEVVSAGSTPTMVRSASGPVTEIRAGTYALGDRQQLALGAIRPDGLATFVAATAVSVPADGRFVLDAGAKALTKDRADFLGGFGLLPAFPEAVIERLYDYHAVCSAGPAGAPAPALGDVVAVVPNHVCPVVDLVDSFTVTRAGRIVGVWPVDARGRSG